ncbi:MAG: carbohydrate deacetylase [Defluviitaleaceae bacterium]|nr:carbohydrate deacetylase [Defluviitaleaceae bacterium]
MKIIFNADDYGYSKGVNLGIIEAFENGIARSATMMANTPGFEHGARLLDHAKGLKIGVHLTLTHGKSLGGAYRTITDARGNFLSKAELENAAHTGKIDLAEVEREYALQIQKILDKKIQITHLDGHHHTHILPNIVDITTHFAKKHDLPVRMISVPFNDTFHGEHTTVEHLAATLPSITTNTEFMCHPAYLDAYLLRMSSYALPRANELETLTNPKTREIIAQFGLTLASFADL